jgi:hypothetical protein
VCLPILIETTQVWQYTDNSAPMQCLFFFASSTGDAQNVSVDNIIVDGY